MTTKAFFSAIQQKQKFGPFAVQQKQKQKNKLLIDKLNLNEHLNLQLLSLYILNTYIYIKYLKKSTAVAATTSCRCSGTPMAGGNPEPWRFRWSGGQPRCQPPLLYYFLNIYIYIQYAYNIKQGNSNHCLRGNG